MAQLSVESRPYTHLILCKETALGKFHMVFPNHPAMILQTTTNVVSSWEMYLRHTARPLIYHPTCTEQWGELMNSLWVKLYWMPLTRGLDSWNRVKISMYSWIEHLIQFHARFCCKSLVKIAPISYLRCHKAQYLDHFYSSFILTKSQMWKLPDHNDIGC